MYLAQNEFVIMEPVIDLESDPHYMREALRLAAKAFAAEETPVGAVVVHAGKIIGRAFNQVEMLNDQTQAVIATATIASGAATLDLMP